MYVVIAILFFGLLIIVHESGHLISAKLCGVKVNEFAVGMGPAILKKQKGETLYSLRCIPFGGYCAMLGEDDQAEIPEEEKERALNNKPIWKRLIIFAAGSFMNFLLGFVIILIVVIVFNFGEVSVWRIIAHSGKLTLNFVKLVWESLGMLVSGEAGLSDLSGPVGIVDIMADTAESAASASDAWFMLSYLGSLISVNLAVMNMLPIPGLDGGHIFLMLVRFVIEKITGKELNPKFEGIINAAGLMLLLALMAFIMLQDIWKVFFNG